MKTKGAFHYGEDAETKIWNIVNTYQDPITTYAVWKAAQEYSNINYKTVKRILNTMVKKRMVVCMNIGQCSLWKAMIVKKA